MTPARAAPAGTCAVIWDFDGTLVDSRLRNMSVNRAILERITGRRGDSFELLTSIKAYDAAVARATNWRDFYAREFGLSETEIESAARLWIDCHGVDRTDMPLFGGIAETLDALSSWPQGIVSQNARAVIEAALAATGLTRHFRAVLGFEEVAAGRQKPAPDALLRCAEELTGLEPGVVFYVGDHRTDTLCAALAREELASRGVAVDVVSIAAGYGVDGSDGWDVRPDHVAGQPAEIVEIVERRLQAARGTAPPPGGGRASP